MCSLDKTLLAFAMLHFVLQHQICLLLWVSLNILFCIPIPYDAKDCVCVCVCVCVLVLDDLTGLSGTSQLQILLH